MSDFRTHKLLKQSSFVKKRQGGPTTIYDDRYRKLVACLVERRKAKGLTQEDIAQRTDIARYDVSKIETFVRRMDILEFEKFANAVKYKLDLLVLLKAS